MILIYTSQTTLAKIADLIADTVVNVTFQLDSAKPILFTSKMGYFYICIENVKFCLNVL